ncbi:glycoside hydrolase superfamily [Delphinella strobiligena]|nr:glycoside hydrolase superfamily [Delphinella strobiligena]
MVQYSSLAVATLVAYASALNLSVSSDGGNATSGRQYGIMFEDINYSGDGGIYAELVRNRAFQGSAVYPSTLTGWSSVGDTTLSLQNLSQPLSSALPTSLNVKVSNGSSGQVGFANAGWWGIDVKVQPYNGSFWVKGIYNGSFTASLVSTTTNTTYGSLSIPAQSSSNNWTEYTYTLTPNAAAPNSNNSLVVTFDASGVSGGSLDFNLISLFPPTYNNRPNGNRIDLMEALIELNPSFFRLPGGNNLEGEDPPYLWYWNQTIGPLTDRPGRPGTWGYENTDGLGLIEYLLWNEDIGAEPIFAVWSGLYLDGTVISNSSLEVYIQYALDELEFLLGSTDTTYGALRASLGYPDPFSINYVEVGNEDHLNGGNSSYSDYRFPDFYNAIHTAYPDITIIASTVEVADLPDGAGGDYHQYTRPDYFVSQFDFFDHSDRANPILIGEYAIVQPNEAGQSGVDWSEARSPFPFWIGTVAEAVFLIGAERNADVILGALYAPTLQNLNAWQWTPDLISYTADPSQDVLSTSWHLINLLSGTRISNTLPTSGGDFGPAYWVAGVGETGSHILKTAVYNTTGDVPVTVSFNGVSAGFTAKLTVLTAPDAYSYNDIGIDVVNTTSTTITASSAGVFTFTLPDLSVSVLEVGGSSNTSSKKSKRAIPKGYREIVF